MIRNLSRRTFLQRLSGVSLAACLGGLLVGRNVEAKPAITAADIHVDSRLGDDGAWFRLAPADTLLGTQDHLPPVMMVKKGTWY